MERPTIRLPNDLYDQVMEQTQGSVQDFVEDATRFWLDVAQDRGAEEPLTAAQQALARRVLRFLRHTDKEEAQAVLLLLNAFEKRWQGR